MNVYSADPRNSCFQFLKWPSSPLRQKIVSYGLLKVLSYRDTEEEQLCKYSNSCVFSSGRKRKPLTFALDGHPNNEQRGRIEYTIGCCRGKKVCSLPSLASIYRLAHYRGYDHNSVRNPYLM